MAKTRSIPYWTMSDRLGSDLRIGHFCSSAVRWLTLHSWTLNFSYDMNPNEFTNELSFITRSEPKRDHHFELSLLLSVSSVATKRVFGEPLSSSGLFRVYSLQRERAYLTVV
jgi:hypothetical protein